MGLSETEASFEGDSSEEDSSLGLSETEASSLFFESTSEGSVTSIVSGVVESTSDLILGSSSIEV